MRGFVGCACAVVLLSSPDAANTSGMRADLTFTRLRGGNYSVWVANADGSAARRIVTRAYDGSLSADGRWLAYSEGATDSRGSGRWSENEEQPL
jgi:Tol biopolymer transport system component